METWRTAFVTEQMEWSWLAEADWRFRRMVRKFVKERDRISVGGISLPGMLVLHKVIRDGGQKLGDLAEELDFTSGAITGLCDKLEEQGFAVRRRLPEDRRIVLLEVTEAGRSFYERNRNIGTACIELLFEGFTAEQLREYTESCERIVANLERFAETILQLAERNAAPPADPPAPERDQDGDRRPDNHFLSY